MDKTTFEIRLASWKPIIEQCQARPKTQTARQWLAENNVPEKQYYYWLRRVRQSLVEENSTALKTIPEKQLPSVAFAEISAGELFQDESARPAIIIRTKKSTIEISSVVSEAMMVRLVKAVAHAL